MKLWSLPIALFALAVAAPEQRRGPDLKYQAMLGDRPPALNYRD
jgi:hypothetical protein